MAKQRPKNQSKIPAATSESKSKFVIPVTVSGVILALQPNTKNILNRLLPMAFPIAISGFFLSAATFEIFNMIRYGMGLQGCGPDNVFREAYLGDSETVTGCGVI